LCNAEQTKKRLIKTKSKLGLKLANKAQLIDGGLKLTNKAQQLIE
jgi:hypothetical protein